MAIPISYNFRNLLVRKTTTVMTALGIALTVAVMLGILGLLAGLKSSFQATGHPLDVLVLRKGATAELSSQVKRTEIQVLRGKKGIQMGNGEQMLSPEVLTVVNLSFRGGEGEANVNVRGLPQVGVRIRAESVKLSDGRWFAPGQRELTVGRGVAETYAGMAIGRQLQISSTYWTIVGVHDGGSTAFNGEIWADANQLGATPAAPRRSARC